MEREFYPEALEEWSKNCPGCTVREELNIAFLTLDSACHQYTKELRYLPVSTILESGTTEPWFVPLMKTNKALYEFTDWHNRLAERHRLSDLTMVLLWWLAEQYGELDTNLREGVTASDEYMQRARDSIPQWSEAFAKLKLAHNQLCEAVVGLATADMESNLHKEFTNLETAYNDAVSKTTTVWNYLLPYQKGRAAQAFKISISGE